MDSFRLISRTLFYRGVQTFFFYVVVTSVDLTKENDETVGAFLRCVFASTLDINNFTKTHAWEYSISVTTKVSNEYVYPLICVLLLFIQIYKDKASVDVS
jgi:hypothetical protein